MAANRQVVLLLLPLALAPLAAPLPAGAGSPDSAALCEPAPQCRAVCNAEAGELRRACGQSGESRRECRARVRAHRAACLESECTAFLPCEGRCRVRAAELLRRCLASGGSTEPCRRDADSALQSCAETQCPGPCLCSHVYDPVCGRDASTYGNTCEARCAGVRIRHVGACDPRCPLVACRLFCPHGFALDSRTGCPICACAAPGPCHCLQVYKPVCGVDGQTYGNTCEAGCAGVEVEHDGRCESRCEPLICQLFCEHGFAEDPDTGCPVCACARRP